MTPRPRLRSLELTGPRALMRRIAFAAIAGASGIAAIGYCLPAHRLVYMPPSLFSGQEGETEFHSNFADGGPLSLVVLLAAAAMVTLLRKRGLGAGMVAGAIGAGGAVLALMPVLLVHLFSAYQEAVGEYFFAMGLIVAFVAGVVLIVAEPCLYLLERRRIEHAARPAALPVAVARPTA